MLVAMNPTPDGKMPGESSSTPRDIQRYLGRISPAKRQNRRGGKKANSFQFILSGAFSCGCVRVWRVWLPSGTP